MRALQQAAASWYRHCFQLVRAEGFYERGIYRRLEPKITWQRGNIQPASQADIERLPEGTRSDGAVTIFTGAFMRTAAAPNQLADRIMFKGVEYEISAVEYWASHNRYVAAKVGQ